MPDLVVTGGGTGGHVFPALEVAQVAKEKGWPVRYFGSERGQEGRACERLGLEFTSFPSGPVYRPYTPRGIRSLANLVKCTRQAERSLSDRRPDIVFSTGGYSSAPVIAACRSLEIPLVVHEQNTVPGRTNRLAGKWARAVCTVFEETSKHFDAQKVHRLGMPIRRELRCGAQGRLPETHSLNGSAPIVFVFGGSQGAEALNEAALATALRMADRDIHWLHVSGPKNYENTMRTLQRVGIKRDYSLKAYLEAEDMAAALFSSALCVCRSGTGTMAELAAYRKPSVLIPLPIAFADHQTTNARVFESIGAATLLPQADLQPSRLQEAIESWLSPQERVDKAGQALAEWDVPDSALQIVALLEEIA